VKKAAITRRHLLTVLALHDMENGELIDRVSVPQLNVFDISAVCAVLHSSRMCVYHRFVVISMQMMTL